MPQDFLNNNIEMEGTSNILDRLNDDDGYESNDIHVLCDGDMNECEIIKRIISTMIAFE